MRPKVLAAGPFCELLLSVSPCFRAASPPRWDSVVGFAFALGFAFAPGFGFAVAVAVANY